MNDSAFRDKGFSRQSSAGGKVSDPACAADYDTGEVGSGKSLDKTK